MRAPVRLLARVTSQVALQQPRPGEHLAADAAAVGQLMSEHVHGQRRHADVRLAAVDALLRRLGIEASVRLLVPGQVRGGRVLLAALRARELRPVRLRCLLVRHRGPVRVRASTLRPAVRHEERLVRVRHRLASAAAGSVAKIHLDNRYILTRLQPTNNSFNKHVSKERLVYLFLVYIQ